MQSVIRKYLSVLILSVLVCGIVVVLVAYKFDYFFNAHGYLTICSVIFFLTSSLGRSGNKILTWSTDSPQENWDNLLSNILAVLGAIFAISALFCC